MTQPTTDTGWSHAQAVAAVNREIGAAETLDIGILTPLSPPGDHTAGNLIIRGACLGVEYARQHGLLPAGLDFRLLVEDDQATSAREGMARSSVAGLAKLAIVDGIIAGMGQWHSRTAPHVLRLAEHIGVPFFAEIGYDHVTDRGYRTAFRTYTMLAERMSLVLEFARSRDLERIAVVAANTTFGQMIADDVQRLARERGDLPDVMRIDFDQESATDIRPQLAEVASFRPDLLINGGVVRSNFMIMRQWAEVGTPHTLQAASFDFPSRSDVFWDAVGDLGNRLIWPATVFRPGYPGLTAMGRWFIDAYRDRFAVYPPDNALSAFTDITLIAQAAHHMASLTRDALIDALEAHEFDSWRGPIRFGEHEGHLHHSPPPLVLMQYQAPHQGLDQAAIIHPPERQTGEVSVP